MMEELTMNDGLVTSASLGDYKMPTIARCSAAEDRAGAGAQRQRPL